MYTYPFTGQINEKRSLSSKLCLIVFTLSACLQNVTVFYKHYIKTFINNTKTFEKNIKIVIYS